MSFPAAVTLAAVLIIAATAALAAVAARLHRQAHQPRHAAPRRLGPITRVPVLADPADITDPDGTQFIADLAAPEPEPQREPELPRRAAQQVKVNFRSAAPSHALLADVLERLCALPSDTGSLAIAPIGLPPAPRVDDTRPQPALITWGGKTAAQLADQLAAEHLGVTR